MAIKKEPENMAIRDFLYILVGRGVGMVIIANNEICHGSENGAGEIGHVFVANNGQLCECGKTGCLETEAGEKAIMCRVRTALKSGKHPVLQNVLKEKREITLQDFIHSVRLNDPDSVEVMQNLCKHLSRAVATAITLLNPRKVIFSGDLIQFSGFTQCMSDEFQKTCPPDSIKSLFLETRNISNTYDAMGAASMAFSHEYWVDSEITRQGKAIDFYI